MKILKKKENPEKKLKEWNVQKRTLLSFNSLIFSNPTSSQIAQNAHDG